MVAVIVQAVITCVYRCSELRWLSSMHAYASQAVMMAVVGGWACCKYDEVSGVQVISRTCGLKCAGLCVESCHVLHRFLMAVLMAICWLSWQQSQHPGSSRCDSKISVRS